MDLNKVYSEDLEKYYPKLGRAVPNPQPGFDSDRNPLPPIKKGDFGFFHENGSFERLGNVHSSPGEDGQPGLDALPVDFEPLVLDELAAGRQRCYLENRPQVYKSKSITSWSVKAGVSGPPLAGDPGINLEFSSKRDRGAILMVPDAVRSYDSRPSDIKVYQTYLASNLPNWKAFADDQSIDLGDLVLVTGMDQTTSWSTAAYAGSRLTAGFGVQVACASVGSARYAMNFDWRHARAVQHNSSPSRTIEEGEPVYNQTIFVRYIRIDGGRSGSFLGIKMKGGAEPRDPDSDSDEPEEGQTSSVVSSSCSEKFTDSLTPVHNYILKNSHASFAIASHYDLEALKAANWSLPIIVSESGVGTLQIDLQADEHDFVDVSSFLPEEAQQHSEDRNNSDLSIPGPSSINTRAIRHGSAPGIGSGGKGSANRSVNSALHDAQGSVPDAADTINSARHLLNAADGSNQMSLDGQLAQQHYSMGPALSDEATQTSAIETTPAHNALPELADELRALADVQWSLYGDTWDLAALDSAISTTRTAIDLSPGELGSDDAELLFDLGVRLNARFQLRDALEDLNGGILALQRAVELTSDENPSQIKRLNRLGTALLERYKRVGEFGDLDAASTTFCCAIELAPDAHPEKPALLNNYGASVLERFKRMGELEDIECSIAILRRAEKLLPDAHPDKPQCFRNLGNSLLSRFECTGELEDLEQAISVHRRAVELTPDGHPNKPSWFNNLGNSLLTCYQRSGELDYLKQAVSTHRCAVELTPDGHPNKPSRFNNLGNSLLTCYRRSGELDYLKQAVSTHRRAVELTPDGHPDKSIPLNNLGNSLLTRFEHTGELEDLEQAISVHRRAVELTPDNHPDKPSWFNNLGNSFRLRFERSGALEDLEQIISTHRRAVELTPDGHPDKSIRLSNLGSSLLTRFERTGELEDLEQAISVHRRAVELTPDNHPDKPSWFNNLGNSFRLRFERSGALEDLEQTISTHRRADELTPDGHPDKSIRRNNFGNSLLIRFERSGELEYLEQAILLCRRAVAVTADDHPQKPVMLGHLCQILCDRFEQADDVADVEEAISVGYRAIQLSPEEHPGLVKHYVALAGCFQLRFQHHGDIGDINAAITFFHKAVELITDSDPRLSSLFGNLGGAQELLFGRTQNQADFEAAVESFTKSMLHPSGSLSARFKSAKRCARILSAHPSLTTAASLLSAHSCIIAILPEIQWLGHGIHRRYEESSQLGELVNGAVAAAITAGALEQAVEWLEAGRTLIWSQILSLRTPLDELRDSHPALAESLQTIQQQLHSSAHNTPARDVEAFSGADGLTVNSAADRHRRLAVEYDALVKEIRACPGFDDFLRPKRFASLIPSPALMSGHIVFTNVHSSRCDAIIISPGGDIAAVPLLNLSLERAVELQRLLADMGGRACAQRGLGSVGDREGGLNPLKCYLRHTWTWIVEPVLASLDLANSIQNDRLPHIVWCPTGPLMQLPLHAAGIYDEPFGPHVYDFVVSSYISKLSAFARSVHAFHEPHEARDMLIVTQPSTPGHTSLPGTVLEGRRLRDAFAASGTKSKWLNNDAATVQEVRAVMEEYPWVHLACHGSQNPADATQSAFHLFDGSLTLSDLMSTVADNAELAFLSACQTAVGNEKTTEESAHFAAGMLAVGFKGVIATMWSIQDADAPIVVEAYYQELLALRSAGTLGQGETGAAYALHEATRVLREKIGEDNFMRWIPFVHFGV